MPDLPIGHVSSIKLKWTDVRNAGLKYWTNRQVGIELLINGC